MIANVRPVKLGREGDDFLVIDWSDGRRDRLRWTEIRKACPCATCNEERLAPPDPRPAPPSSGGGERAFCFRRSRFGGGGGPGSGPSPPDPRGPPGRTRVP